MARPARGKEFLAQAKELREKAFGNLAFNSLDALESHLETALHTLEYDKP